MKTYFFSLTFFFTTSVIYAQLLHQEITALQTDSMIDLDFRMGDTVFHQVYFDLGAPHKEKLLVFLPGTNGIPAEHYREFCKTAAYQGYHSIGLMYKNMTGISGICGTSATVDPDCSEKARMEIIYGTDLSSAVAIDSSNSIMNRLGKLLLHLHTNSQNSGWDNYINPETCEIIWANIALAGHSQGGGHAALIARDNLVHRIIFFNSPSDRNLNIDTPLNQPPWFYDPHITPDSCYYAFYHQQNGGVGRLEIYNLFGLGSYGSNVNIDIEDFPYYHSHIVYTDSTTFDYSAYTNPTCKMRGYNPHSDIIVDCEIPYDAMGNNPYLDVWKYLLNNNTSILSSNNDRDVEENIITIYPNPTTGIFEIRTMIDHYTAHVLNANGAIVQTVLNTGSHRQQINISSLPTGLYFVAIMNTVNSGVTVKKILKMN